MENKVIVLTEEAYLTLNDKLDSLLQKAGVREANKQVEWLTNDDVMKLLDVSKSTLQAYRDKGLITFSQIGRKILYRSTDVDSVLDKFKVPSYKTIKKK